MIFVCAHVRDSTWRVERGGGGGGEGGRRRLVPEGGISYEWGGGGGAAAPPSLCWIRGCLTHPLLFRKSGMAARTAHKKCYGVRRTCRSVSAAYAKFMKCSVPSLTSLSHRLSLLPLPPQWVMLCSVPLTLSKVDVLVDGNPGVTVSLTFNEQLQWAAMIARKRIHPGLSSLFFNLPLIVKNVEDVLKVVQFFGSVKLCIGNPVNIDCFVE